MAASRRRLRAVSRGLGSPGTSSSAASAAEAADLRSVEQAQSTDAWFAASTRDAAEPLPRWATVPRGQRLRYEHPLPAAGVGAVPPEQRGMHIARGSIVSYTARPAGELDASLLAERSLPVMVAAGAEDGPTLLFIAGEHGNEYESIVALQTLMSTVDTATLRGRLVGVPVTSVDSFVNNQRIAQDDGKNLARCWPGRADGSLTERVAYALQRDFLNVPEPHKPVFMVALHTYAHGAGAPNGATLSGYNIYPAAPHLTEAQREASLATGLPLVWGHEMDTMHAASASIGVEDSGRTAMYGKNLADSFSPSRSMRPYI
jgi:hypothetical protein